MSRLLYDAADETETAALGAQLAELLPDRCVVALCGTLGAGKTRLVQAIAEAAGVERGRVVSPTFVLMQEYRGRRNIYHFDAYRLRDEDEFLELGPEEYFDGPGVTLIEWADRVENCLPADRLVIRLETTGPTSRRFDISATSETLDEVVGELCRWNEGR